MTKRKKSEVEKLLEEIPVYHEHIPEGNEDKILEAEGFLASEVREILGGLKTSLDSGAMVNFRKSRISWWNGMRRHGWTNRQIGNSLRRYYRDTDASPWDDFRRDYIPSPRKKTPAEYKKALSARKRARKITKPMYRLLKTKPRQPIDVTIKGRQVTF